jgi:hypothetical protein
MTPTLPSVIFCYPERSAVCAAKDLNYHWGAHFHNEFAFIPWKTNSTIHLNEETRENH